jgi:hypothetical protein
MYEEPEKLEYRDVDFALARRLRGRALQWGIAGSLGLALSGTYLQFGDIVLGLVMLGFVAASGMWLYGYALNCAYVLCARSLPPRVALRWVGGVYRILFPKHASWIIPPSRGR